MFYYCCCCLHEVPSCFSSVCACLCSFVLKRFCICFVISILGDGSGDQPTYQWLRFRLDTRHVKDIVPATLAGWRITSLDDAVFAIGPQRDSDQLVVLRLHSGMCLPSLLSVVCVYVCVCLCVCVSVVCASVGFHLCCTAN